MNGIGFANALFLSGWNAEIRISEICVVWRRNRMPRGRAGKARAIPVAGATAVTEDVCAAQVNLTSSKTKKVPPPE